ncbi:recombinase family protein [Nonomuraea recticatena]|uniref:recombinase family protein n=1 Tax=Nonomuraea recticatena TaxID=46178 RepID=UPI00361DB10E
MTSPTAELPEDSFADLLAACPATRSEILIGYARVSTRDQSLGRQIDALTAAGCRRIFADKKSGKNALRPELTACHAFLSAGDTLVVPQLARYGHSLHDLITMVAELRRREIGFISLHEKLDTTTPGGRLVFHVFAALAEFIRELIVAGTHEGLAAARAAAAPAAAPPSSPPNSSRPPATCCPTPNARSPPSPSCSASRSAPSTTTSPTCRSFAQASSQLSCKGIDLEEGRSLGWRYRH